MVDIKVKIHAEYSNYREKFYGLTLRQIIFGIILIGVAVGTYIYSLPYLGEDIASYLVIIISAPIAFIGFIPVQGLDAEKIIPYWWRNYMKFVKPLKYKTDKQILEEKNEMSKKYRYLEDGTVEKLTKAERKEKAKMLKEKKKQAKIEKKAKKNTKKEIKDNPNIGETTIVSKKQLREMKKQEKAQKKQEKLLLKAQKKFGISEEQKENKNTDKVELVPLKEENAQKDENKVVLEKDTKEQETILNIYEIEKENVGTIITKQETSEKSTKENDLEKEIKKFEMFEKFKEIKPNATEEEFEKFYEWKEANE